MAVCKECRYFESIPDTDNGYCKLMPPIKATERAHTAALREPDMWVFPVVRSDTTECSESKKDE